MYFPLLLIEIILHPFINLVKFSGIVYLNSFEFIFTLKILHFNKCLVNANLTVSTSGNSGMTKYNIENLKNISSKNKNILVKKVFSDVYKDYDLMNDIMSFGFHRVWKKQIFELISPSANDTFLDLAGGSGDISKLICKKFPNNKCILVDSNKKMIEIAKGKLSGTSIKFKCASAEKLPFRNKEFNFIIVAFGLRNFTDMKLSLKEIFRVLKKNGSFICLEFSEVNNSVTKKMFEAYLNLIPFLGKIFVNNYDAYKYLAESIKIFPNQIELTKLINNSGFNKVDCFDLLDGIASIHIGVK